MPAQDILRCIGDAVICMDIASRVTYLNPAAESVTGWSVQAAMGLPIADVIKIIDLTTRESPPHLTGAAIDPDGAAYLPANRILIRRDGTETLIEESVTPIRGQDGHVTGEVIVLRAITEEAQAKALKLSRLAQYDWLTDLPNRMLLRDRLGRALALAARYSRLLAVLFVDLDHFKQVNDSAGHAIGDRVLQSIARRLLACVRSSDTVSRYGGDEFVILLSEIDHPRSLIPLARKILAAIAVPHDLLTPHVFHITASMGISISPENGQDGESLIQSADAAMYWAKRNGPNNIQFFDRRMKA
jgi:diguanylate cyclase (GGDEF)-like protein/PAS domain S-box-containing protein